MGDTFKISIMEDIKQSWEENGYKYGAFLLSGHMDKRDSFNTTKKYMVHMGQNVSIKSHQQVKKR